MRYLLLVSVISLAFSCSIECKAGCRKLESEQVCETMCGCGGGIEKDKFVSGGVEFRLLNVEESDSSWAEKTLNCRVKMLNDCLEKVQSGDDKLECVISSGCDRLLISEAPKITLYSSACEMYCYDLCTPVPDFQACNNICLSRLCTYAAINTVQVSSQNESGTSMKMLFLNLVILTSGASALYLTVKQLSKRRHTYDKQDLFFAME